MRIVAIGGGEIGTTSDVYNLKEIDEEIVKMTNKAHPILLFVGFNERANYFFGKLKKNYMELGVQCTYLKYTELENKRKAESKFKRADIIFMNGGNTMEYMKQIKKYNIDVLFKSALEKNVILCGISAGAICYHKFGSSDSRTYKNDETKFTKVLGIGFIDALFSPHFSNSKRPNDMKRMTKNLKQVAICADNCTALVVDGDDYRVLKSDNTARVYKCFTKNGEYKIYELPNFGKYNELISKV